MFHMEHIIPETNTSPFPIRTADTTGYHPSMKITIPLLTAALLILPVCILGCSSGGSTIRYSGPPVAPSPAMIGHIVLIELNDPSDFHDLLHDADWMLGTIPTVESFAAGKHLDTGRSNVSSDYDFAIYLGFKSERDLAIYVAHQQHVEFVNKWKPKLRSLRIYDMLDWPVTRYGTGV